MRTNPRWNGVGTGWDVARRSIARAMRSLSTRDFDQLIAEAVVRIGMPAVFEYLVDAAHRYGWPIPPHARASVITPLALLVHRRSKLH